MAMRHSPLQFHLFIFSLLILYLQTYFIHSNASGSKNDTKFINPRLHDVLEVSEASLKSRVENKRTEQVSFIMLCSTISRSTNCKETVQGIWNDIAKELHGMAFVGAVDCFTNSELCHKINPDPSLELKEPVVVVYPPLPQEKFVSQKPTTIKAYQSLLSHLYPHNDVTTLNEENIDTFIKTQPALPKAVFFSERTQAPIVLKILAHQFENKINIGMVSSSETSIINKWKIKKFPSLKVLQNNGKQTLYDKDNFSFSALHDWLNIFSETFAFNPEPDIPNTIKSQPWKTEKIPELTEASHKKICFKDSKGICVIYLKKGGPLQEKEIELLENLKTQYDSDSSYRSTKFHWMWLNIEENPAFEELFGEHEYPSLVVINPYKRKRFFGLPNDVVATKDSITNIMEKVLGGDAQFKNFKDVPPFNNPVHNKDEL